MVAPATTLDPRVVGYYFAMEVEANIRGGPMALLQVLHGRISQSAVEPHSCDYAVGYDNPQVCSERIVV